MDLTRQDAADIGLALAWRDDVAATIAGLGEAMASLTRPMEAETEFLTQLGAHATGLTGAPPTATASVAAPAASATEAVAGPHTGGASPRLFDIQTPGTTIALFAPAANAAPMAKSTSALATAPAAPFITPPDTPVPDAPGLANYAGFAPSVPIPALPAPPVPGPSVVQVMQAAPMPPVPASPLAIPGGSAPAWPDMPAAPRLAVAPIVSAPPPTPATAGGMAAPGPQAAPAAATPPQEGRLLLEGFELGRWLTDRLNRDAARPPAGATGFDPRLSPAWPGPAIG